MWLQFQGFYGYLFGNLNKDKGLNIKIIDQ